MANPDLEFGALMKPEAGAYDQERKKTRNARKADEQKAMRAALVRDSRSCRWFDCRTGLVVEPAHRFHRGMGGNPAGDRTKRDSVIALCKRHHRQWDHGQIDVDPVTDKGFDDRVAFYVRQGDEWIHVATEKRIGVSETRT